MRNKNYIILIQVSKQGALNTAYSSNNVSEMKTSEVANWAG